MNPYILDLVKNLANQGICYAFGVSGGGLSLELITALEQRGIKFFPVAHEAAAAFMAGAACADGIARAIAISIKGPGLINFLPGILNNYYENRPALTISEAYGPVDPPTKMHKRLDHFAVLKNIVKAYARPSTDLTIINKLLAYAQAEIPGPVHLDLYAKISAEPAIEYGVAGGLAKQASGSLSDALTVIGKAAQPVVILGSLAPRRLKDLSWSSLQLPVATTAAAKGIFDERSPFAAGIVTGEVKELSPETTILNQADIIVAIGLRNTEVVQPRPFTAPLINIDVADAKFIEGFNPNTNLIVAVENLTSTVSQILKVLSDKNWGESVIKAAREAIDREVLADVWLPGQIFSALNQHFNGDATLIPDTGIFCTLGETVWTASRPLEFLGSSNGRFMGSAIPTAIGFAIANPGRQIICVAGDGGIRPYFPEIKLAVQEHLPIIFVFMSDGGYGTFAKTAQDKNMSQRAYRINNPGWWRAAQALGCPAQPVENITQLKSALKDYDHTKPLFLELPFDKAKYALMAQKLR